MPQPRTSSEEQLARLDQAATRILGTATAAVEATAVATLVVRAVVSLLDERGILPAADVQERALAIAHGAGMPPAIVAAIDQLLDASAALTVPPGAALN